MLCYRHLLLLQWPWPMEAPPNSIPLLGRVGPLPGQIFMARTAPGSLSDRFWYLSRIGACSPPGDHSYKFCNWKDAHFSEMSQFISHVDWLYLLSVNLTTNSLWSAFTSVINTAIDLFVPVRLCRPRAGLSRPTKTYPVSINKHIKRPKVFGCAQIISLLKTEQNHLTRLPRELPNCDGGCVRYGT
jgi:hypothetical protein